MACWMRQAHRPAGVNRPAAAKVVNSVSQVLPEIIYPSSAFAPLRASEVLGADRSPPTKSPEARGAVIQLGQPCFIEADESVASAQAMAAGAAWRFRARKQAESVRKSTRS